MALFSKFQTIPTTCVEYAHPWTESCSNATTVLGIHAVQESFRIYVTVYMLAMIMRGRVPTQKDLKKTIVGICISTLFLSCNSFTFPLFTCAFRKYFGNFNMLSVGFLPAAFASYVSILLERPSRRNLLALYVTNVATETLFRMAVWRGLVRAVPHGQVIIFTISMTLLLYFFRGRETKRDSMYSLLRFIIGPYEEIEYIENHGDLPPVRRFSNLTPQDRTSGKRSKGLIYRLTSTGFVKLFSLGYGLQLCLRILMQMRRLIRKPSLFPKLLIHRNALQLGAFLGGFSGIFKLMSCILRQIFNRDSKYHAIPAGLIAGLAFGFFPDNTVALYVMWKSFQIIYNDSIRKGYVPELPGGNILLYIFSTAVLFHAAVLEPQNLRPSYWKFLQSMSGGRISVMDRKCLDAFGLGTSQSLAETLTKTRTHLVPFSELKGTSTITYVFGNTYSRTFPILIVFLKFFYILIQPTSRAEWDQVYKQLYSNDTTTQMKGFERLLLWKARCPQGIPAGAQCTIDLIQICLKDRELWPKIADGSLPQYHELELQLMYSVAILRFLNHFTPLVKSNPNDSLYDIAKKVHIPDWVVNIRHETAHSQNLPSLNILREATNFCLDWIHEHYWKNEAELTTDLILDGKPTESSDVVINLKDVVEIWQAIMLYSKAGILVYKDIPDEQLKKQLIDKRLNYDTNEIKQLKKKLQADGHIVEDSEIEEAQLVILKELADYLEVCDDCEEAYSLLVDILLEGDGFLASSDFMSVFNTEYDKWRLQNDNLPVHFINLWKTMLDSIQQGKVIPLLLKKLIALTNMESENCNRCRMAALWIKELSQSLFKTKKAGELKKKLLADKDYLHKVKKSFFGKSPKRKLQRKITASDIHRMMIEKIEDDYPDLKQIMTLKIQKLPNSLTQMELLGEAIKKPNKWTNIFLPYLMDLVEPPLSEDGRQKLITLVNIYTQEQLLSNGDKKTESPIYTVDNLENPMPVENKENIALEEVEIEVEDPCMVKFVAAPLARDSIWIRYEDDINWNRCPIGRLPWQDSGSLLNIDFPCETAWQTLHKTDDNYEKTLPGFFHEKINWDEILRKRPRRSRNLQEVHSNIGVVDKAVSVTLIKSN